jgi:hypothetical protein
VEEAGEASVWKRQGRVIWAVWAAEQKGVVQTPAWEAELARAAELVRESERPGRSTCGRPDMRNHTDVRTLVFQIRKHIWA